MIDIARDLDMYHDGAQDGYERALNDVIEMIKDEFPDPNPLASLFETYVGTAIINRINEMKG